MRRIKFSNCVCRLERCWINMNVSIDTNNWLSRSKSQLVIEHVYRTQERSSKTWVFWVYASSVTRFEQSYRDIIDQVKIFERKNSKINILKLVHDWLRNEKNESWLLVLDNVDDTHLFQKIECVDQRVQRTSVDSRNSQTMSTYLSQSQNESLLITSRSKDVAMKLMKEKNIIVVKSMNQTHALMLFKKKLRSLSDNNDIAKLTTTLEYISLAIVQSIAYVCQKTSRCFVRQYLKDFRKNDRKKINLLNYEENQLRKDRETKNSIIITWQISFEHVRRNRSSTVDLLSLMSFFDQQGIFESLIRNQIQSESDRESQNQLDQNNERENEYRSFDVYRESRCDASSHSRLIKLASKVLWSFFWETSSLFESRWRSKVWKWLCEWCNDRSQSVNYFQISNKMQSITWRCVVVVNSLKTLWEDRSRKQEEWVKNRRIRKEIAWFD